MYTPLPALAGSLVPGRETGLRGRPGRRQMGPHGSPLQKRVSEGLGTVGWTWREEHEDTV